MEKEFSNIFGADILKMEFDADMDKGGAYIKVAGETAYIIEVDWEYEEDQMRFVKVPNVTPNNLLDILCEETDNYDVIGQVFVLYSSLKRQNLSESTIAKKMLEMIYSLESKWVLYDNAEINF